MVNPDCDDSSRGHQKAMHDINHHLPSGEETIMIADKNNARADAGASTTWQAFEGLAINASAQKRNALSATLVHSGKSMSTA